MAKFDALRQILFCLLFLVPCVLASDAAACLINWKIARWTSIVNGVETVEINVDACYKYPLLTWLNVIMFFVLWVQIIKILLFATH